MERLKGQYYFKELSTQTFIEQLQQLTHLTFDGDLIGKSTRNELVKLGLVYRFNGWNLITKEGIEYLEKGKFINP
jgi:hypothetical protein